MNRSEKLSALKLKFADLIDKPWPGRRYPGCYDVLQKYYAKYYPTPRQLQDFSLKKIYSFKEEAINDEGGVWAWRSPWGDMLNFDDMKEHDLMLFRVYTDPLYGSYSVPVDRAPNHGGVYLGDGFVLHQLYKKQSTVDDLLKRGNEIYQTACVGGLRENST
tara:strand:- start:31077 stop:31559 length:483 start_codon:yes stop_codon:yes gene_type:complete